MTKDLTLSKATDSTMCDLYLIGKMVSAKRYNFILNIERRLAMKLPLVIFNIN